MILLPVMTLGGSNKDTVPNIKIGPVLLIFGVCLLICGQLLTLKAVLLIHRKPAAQSNSSQLLGSWDRQTILLLLEPHLPKSLLGTVAVGIDGVGDNLLVVHHVCVELTIPELQAMFLEGLHSWSLRATV